MIPPGFHIHSIILSNEEKGSILMKKYIPIIGSICFFIIYLLTQVFWTYEDSVALPSGERKKVFSHYESALKKSVFVTLNSEKIIGSKIQAPIVVLNFWASWCTPCLEEFPSLVKLRKKYPTKKMEIIAINSDDTNALKKIDKKKKEFGLNFKIVHDKKSKHIEDFLISAIPVSIIYHKGKVFSVSKGAKDFYSGEFLQEVDKLLKK
jgi:thiol-disulfide isomerase/thioredoxin